ncbi:hypothetical protein LZ32DRAFT_208783 [Colletotrichum eremochloae]|nr:hypothetical protein LZ32DRAFT_208783 [Colletotrichum eremochloae]
MAGTRNMSRAAWIGSFCSFVFQEPIRLFSFLFRTSRNRFLPFRPYILCLCPFPPLDRLSFPTVPFFANCALLERVSLEGVSPKEGCCYGDRNTPSLVGQYGSGTNVD